MVVIHRIVNVQFFEKMKKIYIFKNICVIMEKFFEITTSDT